MTRRLVQVALLVLGIGMTLPVHAADPTYTVRELSQFARATDINNGGDVVGWQHPGKGILLRSGQSQVEYIGSLGGAFTYPRAINDNVQVVGESMLGDELTYHAFLYSGGVTRDLGTAAGQTESGATDINRNGQVTGWTKSGSLMRPFFYSNGRTTVMDFSMLWGVLWASAAAMNDRGEAAGSFEATDENGLPLAGMWRYSSSQEHLTLSTLGAQGFGINSNSLIVGTARFPWNSPVTHAAAWWDGAFARPTDLGTLPGYINSVAKGVNRNALIVGYSYGANDVPETRRAFIYLSGWMFDLNDRLATAGWLIREAIAINDNGQILAEGCDAQAMCGKALLLTPTTSQRGKRPPRR